MKSRLLLRFSNDTLADFAFHYACIKMLQDTVIFNKFTIYPTFPCNKIMNDIDEWPELQMSSIKHKFKTKKWTLQVCPYRKRDRIANNTMCYRTFNNFLFQLLLCLPFLIMPRSNELSMRCRESEWESSMAWRNLGKNFQANHWFVLKLNVVFSC